MTHPDLDVKSKLHVQQCPACVRCHWLNSTQRSHGMSVRGTDVRLLLHTWSSTVASRIAIHRAHHLATILLTNSNTFKFKASYSACMSGTP